VHASAEAMLELEKGAYEKAAKNLTDAIGKIEALDDLEEDTFKFERERSLMALRELQAKIQTNRPLSELERLEHQLRRAIDKQEFERAAKLRDRIRELKQQHIC
jgi:excinuclease UvrABC helicase subunit UvrB